MIELSCNLLELLTVGLCLAAALIRFFRTRKKGWILLSFVFTSYFLGDLYWALYLFFYHRTPPVFYVSETSWCATYLFLILMLRHYQTDTERNTWSHVLWAIPVFIAGLTVFYMTRGSYLLNLIDAILMGSLMIRSTQGLLALRETADRRKSFYTAVFCFCLVEYGLWTASCFWLGDTIRNPYFWFALLLIATHPLFYLTVRKAEGE